MISARDYSNCPDPAAAMRADAIARRARLFSGPIIKAPVSIAAIERYREIKVIQCVRDESVDQRIRDASAAKEAAWNVALAAAIAKHVTAPTVVMSRRVDKQIIDIVARMTDLSVREIMSRRRTKEVAWARQIAMWLCLRFTGKSLPEIGRRFNGRDHTTVLHARRKIDVFAVTVTPAEDTVEAWVTALWPFMGGRT